MKYLQLCLISLFIIPHLISADVTPPNPQNPLVLTEKGKIIQIIQSYDWNTSEAIKIAQCESRFNKFEHNANSSTGDDSYGVFQVNLYGDLKKTRPKPSDLVIPEKNIAFAYNLWKSEKVKWSDWYNCAKDSGLLE